MCAAEIGPFAPEIRASAIPIMPCNGVRNSCDVVARNSSFSLFASCNSSFCLRMISKLLSNSLFCDLISDIFSRMERCIRSKLTAKRPISLPHRF
ncbi:Uncharacterised protein [Vibrio cholerae]|nr:Uncharacterised protein [Vibrio cholerae]